MDSWALMFLGTLDKAGITVNAFMKYVDDINIVYRMLPWVHIGWVTTWR